VTTHIIDVEMHERQTGGYWAHYTCPQGCLTGYVWTKGAKEEIDQALGGLVYAHARDHIVKEHTSE
jgi:hypothetical protein